MADDEMASAEAANLWLKNCAGFLKWEVVGTLNAKNCNTLDDLMKTDYTEKAYEFGKNFY